jgi:hypothetical protein
VFLLVAAVTWRAVSDDAGVKDREDRKVICERAAAGWRDRLR